MDEPTSSLTKKEIRSLFAVIKGLQAQGISTLFVSHKLDEVFEISDRFTIIRNGVNVATGNTRDLDRITFAYHMTGRHFQNESYACNVLDKKPVVSVRNLSRGNSYSEISFDLFPGEILGITGLLGSGRTELVQTLFGIYRADNGFIEVCGKTLRGGNVREAIRRGIGYVPADRLTEGLFLPQSIGRNIVVSKLGPLSTALGFLRSRAIAREVIHQISEFSIVAGNSALPVQTLSGGNQQKVVVARWLANNLSVLILNGPTIGVDIGSKYDIHALLRRLASDGLAVILISDDLPEILACTSRIVVMRDGAILKQLDPAATTEAQLVDLSTGAA
jgi:simple sugar transport system ATP-binding protein